MNAPQYAPLFLLLATCCLVMSCGEYETTGEVKAYAYNIKKNCYEADSYILIGPFEGRSDKHIQDLDSPGCWINEAESRIAYTAYLGKPDSQIIELGYENCEKYTQGEPPTECTTNREFDYRTIERR